MKAEGPEFLIEHAVRGMLSENKLSRKLITKMKYLEAIAFKRTSTTNCY
jgi:ribosomal protein L13